ncbi:hypothetical protein HXX76_014047 [Chlamydomonas incerta]|uniref:Uncharacterized protein n=1 Tax=Chlamydomonas incerta TaxID=51695 RepID=A0A835VTG0_CHLIN|nr:hypothetical protein HXX76_014047 [Chlamydomonas incerta]|eukprot:KAG2424889.1 hypothetical protein HXX76_014047 [Chlamydomonas incerta]
MASSLLKAIFGTAPGRVASVGYVLLLILTTIAIVQNNRRAPRKQALNGAEIFLVFVLIVLAYVAQVYSINCMVFGKAGGVGCGVWAWINSLVVLIMAVVVLLKVLFTGGGGTTYQYLPTIGVPAVTDVAPERVS